MLRRRGFTLIELLIILALSSFLLSILFPALAAARREARRLECLATQSRLHNAALAYALNDNEWLPGLNRTGLPLLKSIAAAQAIEGDTTPGTPTSTFDWISPAIGEGANLSPNRARRTKQIFEDHGCAEARRQNDKTWGFSNDLSSDFLPLIQEEGIRQISYLAPAPFHYAGQAWKRSEFVRFPFRGPATPPPRYLPRLEKVGSQPSTKVFVADGSRYLTAGNVLDFDVHPAPEFYGSFTSSTPIYVASTAYGLGQGVTGFDVGGADRKVHNERRRLSYRHSGKLNVMYFDGHGGSMSWEDSRTDAAAWYPSGSTFTGVAATEESLAKHRKHSILR